MSIQAAVTHILPVTLIQRRRILPVPGRVVVRKGQKVNPTDVIAEAKVSPEHLLLDIARGLGVPAAKADKYLQHKAGDEVSEKDIIAGPVGFLSKRVVRAPRSGRVVLAGGGQVLLEVESKPFELKAGLAGVVTDLIEDHGAEIETTGALVQGAWGNGRLDFGLLGLLIKSPDDVLTHSQLDVSQRGAVLLGGYLEEPETLTAAAEIPVRGLVLASMASELLPLAARMPYPIIVLEGFGKIPMNPVAYKLLTTNERRDISLNAEPWNTLAGTRPELIISLPAPANTLMPNDAANFNPGQTVRVLSMQYLGKVGGLVNIRPVATVMPSGLKVPAADVHLESGEDVVIPLANLEVLG